MVILPIILHGAPVWVKAMKIESYKYKLIRMQRIINIKMAKSNRTVSNEALYILTGMTHIAIKIEVTAQMYRLKTRRARYKYSPTAVRQRKG